MSIPQSDKTGNGKAREKIEYLFAPLPLEVLRCKELSHGAVRVCAWLAHHMGAKGCFPKQEELAEEMGCSDRMVRTYLDELEAAGFLTRERRGYAKSNVYRLNINNIHSGSLFPVSCPTPEAGFRSVRKQASGPVRKQASERITRTSELEPNNQTQEGAAAPPTPARASAEVSSSGTQTAKPRDALFDAVCQVTASDPKVSGSHVGRVCKALRAADPPYTPAEVVQFGESVKRWRDFEGPPTLGCLEKNIGQVRATHEPGTIGTGTGHAGQRHGQKPRSSARYAGD